ncbi:hypothetical protein PsorP6_000680 [Peronosclerospora sorghi]|uniref:Uncharacterized protein n=1 Tax=Peronosclerospora sorghi TaxID=230839 RepID=A0ACC0WUV2_9STRA|nr:hypothetical protein PsorP6_000680 [Peronosclerospora sorghi]
MSSFDWLKKTLDLSSHKWTKTQLTTEQLNTVESNLQTFSMQSWAQEYSSSCKTIEISGMTILQKGIVRLYRVATEIHQLEADL